MFRCCKTCSAKLIRLRLHSRLKLQTSIELVSFKNSFVTRKSNYLQIKSNTSLCLLTRSSRVSTSKQFECLLLPLSVGNLCLMLSLLLVFTYWAPGALHPALAMSSKACVNSAQARCNASTYRSSSWGTSVDFFSIFAQNMGRCQASWRNWAASTLHQ